MLLPYTALERRQRCQGSTQQVGDSWSAQAWMASLVSRAYRVLNSKVFGLSGLGFGVLNSGLGVIRFKF